MFIYIYIYTFITFVRIMKRKVYLTADMELGKEFYANIDRPQQPRLSNFSHIFASESTQTWK